MDFLDKIAKIRVSGCEDFVENPRVCDVFFILFLFLGGNKDVQRSREICPKS